MDYMQKIQYAANSFYNRGLELAEGELFFTMDSDDYLTDDALEKVDRWEKALPKGRICDL